MTNEVELEIKFQNQSVSDLESQIIQIVRKYADLKCQLEATKNSKKTSKKHVVDETSRYDTKYIERLDNNQIMNILGIQKNHHMKCEHKE